MSFLENKSMPRDDGLWVSAGFILAFQIRSNRPKSSDKRRMPWLASHSRALLSVAGPLVGGCGPTACACLAPVHSHVGMGRQLGWNYIALLTFPNRKAKIWCGEVATKVICFS